jgi:hypothetical protein
MSTLLLVAVWLSARGRFRLAGDAVPGMNQPLDHALLSHSRVVRRFSCHLADGDATERSDLLSKSRPPLRMAFDHLSKHRLLAGKRNIRAPPTVLSCLGQKRSRHQTVLNRVRDHFRNHESLGPYWVFRPARFTFIEVRPKCWILQDCPPRIVKPLYAIVGSAQSRYGVVCAGLERKLTSLPGENQYRNDDATGTHDTGYV